jgi:hypothetical protein
MSLGQGFISGQNAIILEHIVARDEATASANVEIASHARYARNDD